LNLVILHADENRWDSILSRPQKQQRIDVWWSNDATSRLMLLLAYLMTRQAIWSKATIRVLSSENSEDKDNDDKDNNNDDLEKLMEDIRIDADPVIVQDNKADTMIEMSSKSSFVFLPFRIRENHVLDAQGGSLLRLLPYLPMSALVMAAQDIDLEAEPDTGAPGELAKAQDALNEANDRYKAAEKVSQKCRKKSEILTAGLVKYPKESEDFQQALKTADQALKEEEDAFRRAAKAKAKAEQAAGTLERILKGTGKESKEDVDAK